MASRSGKMADHVGGPADLAGEGAEGQQVALGDGQMLGRGREPGLERLHYAGELGSDLSEDPAGF
jgi:hypothetical protein